MAEISAALASKPESWQFLEGTWVEALRRFGSKHGFSAAAEAIRVDRGRATVAEEKNRKWILSLRRDLSALMAGEMVNTHRQILSKEVARDPSFAELYFAHLMGVRGATRLVELKETAETERPKRISAGRERESLTVLWSESVG